MTGFVLQNAAFVVGSRDKPVAVSNADVEAGGGAQQQSVLSVLRVGTFVTQHRAAKLNFA